MNYTYCVSNYIHYISLDRGKTWKESDIIINNN